MEIIIETVKKQSEHGAEYGACSAECLGIQNIKYFSWNGGVRIIRLLFLLILLDLHLFEGQASPPPG